MINLKNKKGLSAVVNVLLIILLSVVAIGLVWVFVSNFVNEELEGADSCINIFDKVQINGRYTCYNSTSNELQFSLNIGDIEVEEVLFAISGQGSTVSFNIKNVGEDVSGVTSYSDGSEIVALPNKNSGLTYVYDMNVGGLSQSPDDLKISPIINGKQCSASDSVSDFPSCSSLV